MKAGGGRGRANQSAQLQLVGPAVAAARFRDRRSVPRQLVRLQGVLRPDFSRGCEAYGAAKGDLPDCRRDAAETTGTAQAGRDHPRARREETQTRPQSQDRRTDPGMAGDLVESLRRHGISWDPPLLLPAEDRSCSSAHDHRLSRDDAPITARAASPSRTPTGSPTAAEPEPVAYEDIQILGL
jgi:hypothetical protein